MNILLSSVGRRNFLVECFKKELQPLGGKVHAMNSDIDSVGLLAADCRIQAPLIHSKEYVNFLLDYCVKHTIKAVISFFDIELSILSKLKQSFESIGISLIVGDEWVTKMANDKWLTYLFLQENSFSSASTYIELDKAIDDINTGKLNYPVFIKPRWGMGSLSVFKAENEYELLFFYYKAQKDIFNSYLKYESLKEKEKCVIIQAALPGIECGLDVINDLNGNHIITVAKQKLSMRAGETDGAIILNNKQLSEIGAKLASITKHPANMDVDIFWDEHKAYILELNPRFGGGYAFSHIAGINLPGAIVKWLNNEKVDLEEYFNLQTGIKAFNGNKILMQNSGIKE